MKYFNIFTFLSLGVLVAAGPNGYKYQPSQIRPGVPVGNLHPQAPPSSNGIFTAQQALPLPQANNQAVSGVQQLPLLNIQAPVPAPSSAAFVPQAAPALLSQPAPAVGVAGPSYNAQYQQSVQAQQFVQGGQRPAIVTKDIYIHSAPDDNDDLSSPADFENVPVRKNYRIVFIKAPSQNLKQTAAALKRAQATNEEKTVIYVLSKKPNLAEIQQQLQLNQNEQRVNKPEVYFIKYKTQEEAQRAQQEIQAQYDALGGATHISDEGIAPVTTVSSGALNLSGPIQGPNGGGAFLQPNFQNFIEPRNQQQQQQQISFGQQQQSFVQQNYQAQGSLSSSSSSAGLGSFSNKYLPSKTVK